MLNVGGGELILIGLVALIALGPEQLPTVMRKLGALTNQIRSLSSGLRQEFLSGLDEAVADKRDGGRHPLGPDPGGARPSGEGGDPGLFDGGRPIVPPGFAARQGPTGQDPGVERARLEAEQARLQAEIDQLRARQAELGEPQPGRAGDGASPLAGRPNGHDPSGVPAPGEDPR
jgi:sec-independent protein translocase protein TatB